MTTLSGKEVAWGGGERLEGGKKGDQPGYPGVTSGSPTEPRILSATAWNIEGLQILTLGQKQGWGCRWGGREVFSLYPRKGVSVSKELSVLMRF